MGTIVLWEQGQYGCENIGMWDYKAVGTVQLWEYRAVGT